MADGSMPAADTPPHDLDAERTVLGAPLLARGIVPVLSGVIRADDFYHPAHAVIWEAECALDAKEIPIDVGTLASELRRQDRLSTVGGPQYLGELLDVTATAAHAEHHARIVVDLAGLRRALALAVETQARVRAGGMSAAQLVAHVRQSLDAIARHTESRKPRHIGEIIQEVYARLEQRSEPEAHGGIRPKLRDLERAISAWFPSKLIVIAGRPGSGKSAMAMGEAVEAARKNVPTLVFSLEMPDVELGERALSGEAGVDSKRIRDPRAITQDDMERFAPAAQTLFDMPLWIVDEASLTVGEMRAIAYEHKARHGLGLVVVDYLQLAEADEQRPGMSREREVTMVSKALKRLAKDLEVPVIAAAQLNRELEQRPNKRPQLSDLRESGGIEQDADLVLFLYRDEMYNRESPDRGIVEIGVAKQRGGETPVVLAAFERTTTTFSDLTEEQKVGIEERRRNPPEKRGRSSAADRLRERMSTPTQLPFADHGEIP